jgi:hypothetical protein
MEKLTISLPNTIVQFESRIPSKSVIHITSKEILKKFPYDIDYLELANHQNGLFLTGYKYEYKTPRSGHVRNAGECCIAFIVGLVISAWCRKSVKIFEGQVSIKKDT